jgi:hypothetical protein
MITFATVMAVSIATGCWAQMSFGRTGAVWGLFAFACQAIVWWVLDLTFEYMHLTEPQNFVAANAWTPALYNDDSMTVIVTLGAVLVGGGFAALIVATLPGLNRVHRSAAKTVGER